ncbi:hypothetical protein ACLOJK_010651 [Asimina triloba]
MWICKRRRTLESHRCCCLLRQSKFISRETTSTLPSDPPSPCTNLVVASTAALQYDHLLAMAAKSQPLNFKCMISMAHQQRLHASFHAAVCSPIARLVLPLVCLCSSSLDPVGKIHLHQSIATTIDHHSSHHGSVRSKTSMLLFPPLATCLIAAHRKAIKSTPDLHDPQPTNQRCRIIPAAH